MPIMPLPTPPETIELKEYFESWLPEQLAGLAPVVKDKAPDLNLAMGFRAEGENGGDWTLSIGGGEVKTSPGLAPDAVITLVLSAKDLKEVVSGKRPLMPGMGRRKKAPDKQPDPEKAARRMTKMANAVKDVKGMIEFKVDAKEGPGFKARICFGPVLDEPTVGITIDEDDMKAMQSGELNPQSAFMGGKVHIEGDMGFLMLLAPMVMG